MAVFVMHDNCDGAELRDLARRERDGRVGQNDQGRSPTGFPVPVLGRIQQSQVVEQECRVLVVRAKLRLAKLQGLPGEPPASQYAGRARGRPGMVMRPPGPVSVLAFGRWTPVHLTDEKTIGMPPVG